jgi:4-aminobutyrate aminotransferase-like enzyme
VACAAALAQLAVIDEEGLIERAAYVGERIRSRAQRWQADIAGVRTVRGVGVLQGVVLEGGHAPAARVMTAALAGGVMLVPEGSAGDVVAITPPAVITDAQLDAALDVVERALRAVL